jgi:hypothetical protein
MKFSFFWDKSKGEGKGIQITKGMGIQITKGKGTQIIKGWGRL